MIFDTHVHYNLEPLSSKWQHHWQEAQKAGVTKSVIVGTDFQSSSIAVQIAKQDLNLFASIGHHPSMYSQIAANEINQAIAIGRAELQLILDETKVVAIGEIGLDYFRLDQLSDEHKIEVAKRNQRLAFEEHIHLALEENLPIIVHARDKDTPEIETEGNAYWDVLKILQKFSASNTNSHKLKFVLHCASGPLQFIEAAIRLGAYIGADGNITYQNADHIRQIVSIAPKNKLLVETDAPYLPPQPHRGKICQPWMISLTVDYIETHFEVSKQQLFQNSLDFFNLQ